MVTRKVMIGAVAAALTLGGTAALAGAAGTTGSGAGTAGTAASGQAQAAIVNTASSSQPAISKTQAKAIALKAQKGTVDEIELERYNGKLYYEVDIDRQWGDVDVWVDATTGSILKVVEDDDLNDDRDDGAVRSGQTGSSNTGQTAASVKYTAAQAEDIALKHVGDGRVTDNDLDREDGVYVYEIEVKNGRTETDVVVDANTGKVLWSDTDDHDDDDDDDDDRYDDRDDDHDDD